MGSSLPCCYYGVLLLVVVGHHLQSIGYYLVLCCGGRAAAPVVLPAKVALRHSGQAKSKKDRGNADLDDGQGSTAFNSTRYELKNRFSISIQP